MMDTYFPSINNQRNAAITPYTEDPKIYSYSEMPFCSNSMVMGLNQGPAHGFYSSTSNCVDSMEGRYEMAFLPQFGPSLGIQDFASELETEKIDQLGVPNGGKNSQCGGLSLSLGSKISFSAGNRSAAEMESFPNSSGFAALGRMNSNVYDPYEASVLAKTGLNSKYVKAAQQLLDEVVNIRAALNGVRYNKHKSFANSSNNNNGGSSGRSLDMSSSYGTSTTNPSRELSSVERQDLKNRSAKLLSMVEEVDERYRQYYQQMQIMVSSFDMIAGCGAAELYTALAHQTISCHFRRLRDGISDQIQVMRRNLGEEDCSSAGQRGIPRLRYVDQQLRQHRALQQLGLTRHSWRPQRGLPESSVSILRAWLFEHFLHPYPKDTEKLMLARQTGLTRNQVANWFINARVRLWKPMVEEMYKEEFGDPTMDFNFSPENTSGAPKNCSFPFEDRDEDLQGSVISSNADGEQIQESISNEISGMETKENASKIGIKSLGNAENIANHSLYPHDVILSNQVSLALELRHCEKNDGFLKSDIVSNAEDAPMGKCRLGSPHLLHDFVACKSDCL